jgi:hypothetical protein
MFAAARPRNTDLRPTARTDIALRGWACSPRTASLRVGVGIRVGVGVQGLSVMGRDR